MYKQNKSLKYRCKPIKKTSKKKKSVVALYKFYGKSNKIGQLDCVVHFAAEGVQKGCLSTNYT